MGYVGKKPADIIATAVDTTTGTFSGDLTVDTNTLYVDSANNRVGVGTVSPSVPFHVNGGTENIVAKFESTDADCLIEFADNATSDTILLGADTDDLLFRCDPGNITFKTNNNTEAMRIDSSGNVGIGVVPETWTTALSTRVLQVGDVTSIHEVASQYSRFASNMYYDGTFKYITSNPATRYTQQGGTHVWDYASSGSADGAITFNEAMRINSSGNLFVGNTAEFVDGTGTGDTGIQLNPIGLTISTRNGGISGIFGRQSSDGDILQFRKDGTTVGSIGTFGSALYISSPDGTDAGLRVGNSTVLPVTTTGALRDNAIDLGSASARWKDLYLTGGIQFDSRSNKLDDYEEGTWTPSMGGTTTYYYQTGEYTKIGNMVFLRGQVSINAIGTGSLSTISGLPFTSKTTLNGNPAGTLTVSYYSGLAISINYIGGHVVSAATTITIIGNAGNNTTIQYNGGNFFGNGARLDFTMAYQVA